jgi:hypothetical protein
VLALRILGEMSECALLRLDAQIPEDHAKFLEQAVTEPPCSVLVIPLEVGSTVTSIKCISIHCVFIKN